jgi:1,4-alpha-glucan branching enzyme
MSVGSLVLVLHGHLPYVLHHGEWPHGEDWLYEAAAESYLPLLEVIGHCLLYERPPKLVVGLTPVLLEQLSHGHFQVGFRRWLEDRITRAEADRSAFTSSGELHAAWLADRWARRFRDLRDRFESNDGDLPAAFAAHHRDGAIELLSSAATHGYLPLLYEDKSVRAQIRAGLASSRRILGFSPRGVWLPECAYRPEGPWSPPNGWAGKSWRPGIQHLLADEGVTHTFVESHLVGDWRVNEPYRLGCGEGRSMAVLARDRSLCEHVWSGDMGYPADGAYLEFHKRHGPGRGLRYWKITGKGVDLGAKHWYHPDDVARKVHEHVEHFRWMVRERLRRYQRSTGQPGVVVATFDLELFGHWWFEGPEFLRDLILSVHADPEIELATAEEVLRDHPPQHTIAMPEGSWGDRGDHRVWTHDRVRWMWDVMYRCEHDFERARHELGDDARASDLLRRAGRELLLLQASDWIFVITREQAVDYGIRRFVQHVVRFDTMLELARRASQDPQGLPALSEAERARLREADTHDVVFPRVELGWWA